MFTIWVEHHFYPEMTPPACGECSDSVRKLFQQWLKLLTPTQPSLQDYTRGTQR